MTIWVVSYRLNIDGSLKFYSSRTMLTWNVVFVHKAEQRSVIFLLLFPLRVLIAFYLV